MIYFFDGSKEAFFTAFLAAYADEEAFVTCTQTQLSLCQQSVYIRANAQQAQRAENRFKTLDKHCLHELDYLLRSGEANRAQIAFRYFRLIAQKQRPVREMLAEEVVIAATECIKRVGIEIHRMKGFIRFIESASGALYAPFSPDHDICDLLVPHFRARFPKYPFLLHDVTRKKAAVYDGSHSFLVPLDQAEVVLSANEQELNALWKRYYASVNIPSRERLKQMRGYMPVRYWKFLPEVASTDVE